MNGYQIEGLLTLGDILDRASRKIITLPTVQRGFVWKPYQIENLWDSLLRGYPIGAFVVSKKDGASEEYELLDGQQRASAICLGFHNPATVSDTISHSGLDNKATTDNIMIFVDLAKPDADADNRKFLIRVITKSHPWGYRKLENQKVLEANAIAEAMQGFGEAGKDYLNTPLSAFWPYDAFHPIPLGMFVDAACTGRAPEELSTDVENWCMSKGPLYRSKYEKKEESGSQPHSINATQDCYTISELLSAVREMLNIQRVPVLHLAYSQVLGAPPKVNSPESPTMTLGDADEATDQEQKVTIDNDLPNVEDPRNSDIENLFIRLNSAGTPLRGEELNYSVLKAHITDRRLLQRMEEKCKGLFHPARFITIAFRLFNNRASDSRTGSEARSMKIKPRQFQKSIRGNDAFVVFLQHELVDSDVIEKAKAVLLYNQTANSKGLPAFVVSSIAERAPEIMFMLLYRIQHWKDDLSDDKRTAAIGMVTLFTWFGRSQNQRDHSKLLNCMWPCLLGFERDRFWSAETIQRLLMHNSENYELLIPFPNMKNLRKLVPEDADIRSLTWQNLTKGDFGSFIDHAFFTRDLVLFAQRSSLSEWFRQTEGLDLDDTNRPFDWDHISPNGAVRSKRRIKEALRDWYPSIGNLRAWPYSLNRKDQDAAPSDKLSIQSESNLNWYYSHTTCCHVPGDVEAYIPKASFCAAEWLELNADAMNRIRENGEAKKIAYCILNRSIDICREWHEQLEIDRLIPQYQSKTQIKKLLLSVVDRRLWHDDGLTDSDQHEFSLKLDSTGDNLFMNIDLDDNPLQESSIYFGVYRVDEKDQHASLKVRIPTKDEGIFFKNGEGVIFGSFTLASLSEDSVIALFKSFREWLSKFPNQAIKQSAIHGFEDSIRKEFQKHILSS